MRPIAAARLPPMRARPRPLPRGTPAPQQQTRNVTPAARRGFSAAPPRLAAGRESPEGAAAGGGAAARTNPAVKVEYPAGGEGLRPSRPAERPTLPAFTLEGKVVAVTGGARGLGLVMGQGVVWSGGDLAIVDLNKEEAEKQAQILTERYKQDHPTSTRTPRVTAHRADVSLSESVSACVDEIVASHGRVDGLVTSAGFTENFPAVEYPVERVRRLWGVNVDGTFLFATAVARHLMGRGEGGSMVLVGSMSGEIVNVPQPQAPYNAAKAAVRHLAASLAVEWAEHNIRVNCISPGYMLTALTQKIMDDNPEMRDQWISRIPMGRMGNPPDLMGPVTFLLSDAARYVTGADMRVDGGYTLT